MLSSVQILFLLLTLVLVSALGVYSLRRIRSADDFNVGGRRAGASIIVGTITGTLVGGASTIGTTQMAFTYGFSAWWYTLGGGIACLFLGIFLAGPLRRTGATTGAEILAASYGPRAGLAAVVFSSIGIFMSVIAQILAAEALLVSFTGWPPLVAAVAAVALVILYVIFGGVWGTGLVGTLKLALLYVAMLAAGFLAYSGGGGLDGFRAALPEGDWFSLFAQGVNRDLGAAFSMLVGVASTQTYLQAVFSGRSEQSSRRGALISGLMIPPIGLAGVFIGLFMRVRFPEIDGLLALPLFVINFLPDWLGGVVLATLLVTVIGSGAGLVLGMSTMLSQDVYRQFIAPKASDQTILRASRLVIILVTGLTLLFAVGSGNSLIMKWSFLGMGLRGAAICLPLLAAVFWKGRIDPRAGAAAVIFAPLASLLWAVLLPEAGDPLFIGLFVSLIILLLGSRSRQLTATAIAAADSGGYDIRDQQRQRQ